MGIESFFSIQYSTAAQNCTSNRATFSQDDLDHYQSSLTILSHFSELLQTQFCIPSRLSIRGWVNSPYSCAGHCLVDREVITRCYAGGPAALCQWVTQHCVPAAAVYSAICVPTSHTLRDVFLAQYQRYSSLFNCWGLGCQESGFLPQHLSAS